MSEKQETASPSAAPSAPVRKQPQKPRKPSGLLTPQECAEKSGNLLRLAFNVRGRPVGNARTAGQPNAAHRAADYLHGWSAHEHHAAKSMKLTMQQYEAAIATTADPFGIGDPKPHPEALSEHHPRFGKDKRALSAAFKSLGSADYQRASMADLLKMFGAD